MAVGILRIITILTALVKLLTQLRSPGSSLTRRTTVAGSFIAEKRGISHIAAQQIVLNKITKLIHLQRWRTLHNLPKTPPKTLDDECAPSGLFDSLPDLESVTAPTTYFNWAEKIKSVQKTLKCKYNSAD